MNETWAAELWMQLGAAGGALALAFIVALALCIAALTALFSASAVVVLERFARAKAPVGIHIAMHLAWAALLGLLGTDRETFESTGFVWPGLLLAWFSSALAALCCIAIASLLIALVLRLIPRRLLGWLCGGFLLCGFALLFSDAAFLGIAASLWGRLLLLSFALGIALGLLPLAAAGFFAMRGSVEWFIARRYLFAKRRQTFISVITGICVAGVAVGVWLIVTVLSVMNGFERTWREEIIGNRAHLTVMNSAEPMADYEARTEQILTLPDVVGASPYLDSEGLVRGAQGEIVGVRVRGIDPQRVTSVTDLREDLLPGSENALAQLGPDAQGRPGIIVGSQLALAAGVQRGDLLTFISPFGGALTPLGAAPRLKQFRIAGIFKTSFFQYDEVFTYTGLAAAQDFRRAGDVAHGIEVKTTDYYRSRSIGGEIARELGRPFVARDWKDYFPTFFQALKTERVMMFVLLTMIMVVAAFAIVVTLIMMIMEKSGDIAILKTMGASDAAVERVFAIEGALIGLLGTVLGIVSGIAVTTQLDWVQAQVEAVFRIDVLPPDIYQFSTLPWLLDTGQLAIISAIAMVLALGATLLPSRHGARVRPAEALRYE